MPEKEKEKENGNNVLRLRSYLTMIIQWILFICFTVFSVYVRLYFFLRASNYYSDKSLNLKRIYAIIYYIFTLSYCVYMFFVVFDNLDVIGGDFLFTFISWLLIMNFAMNVLFVTSLTYKG